MTDINGIVVGLQGNPVDPESPTDGYVLTWDGDDGYWAPRPVSQPSTGLNKEYFTTSGTWTCPAGITSILIVACGGASGGAAGRGSGGGGSSGINAIQVMTLVSVTPGVTYTITIGAGGIGGTGDKITQPDNYTSPTTLINYVLPTSGNSTYFSYSGTILFSVKGATALINSPDSFINTYNNGSDGSTAVSGTFSGQGGFGGLAGPQGNGGNGGNGAKSTGGTPATASNGSNAGANTGAGGGGGGGCGNQGTPYTSTGGDGGNGGSGYMYIVY